MKRAIVMALVILGCKSKQQQVAKEDNTVLPAPTGRRPIADTLVGKDPRKLAFETRPLIGLTHEELVAAYGEVISKETALGGRLLFPQALDIPDAPSKKPQDLVVHFMILEGEVATYDIFLHGSVQEPLVAALENVRGQPSGSLASGGLLWNTTPPLRLRLESAGGTITPYLKLSVNPLSDQ